MKAPLSLIALALALAGYTAGRAVVSPDGQHWMWGTSSFGGSSVTSKLMLGSRGAPDRVIDQETSQESHFEPYRWTSAGPTYVAAPVGVGGYILFEIGGSPSWRFDVD